MAESVTIEDLKKEIERIKKEDPERFEEIAMLCIGFTIGRRASELGIKIEGVTQ